MKNFKIAIMVFFAILFSSAILMSCNDPLEGINPVGSVLILQAYGNAGEDDAPGGVSHSFVELYNESNKEIDLTGTVLWFANGRRGLDVITDEPWQSISLDGKTIPAKGSFLILGKKHVAANASVTRLMLQDDYGDIQSDALALSRRGFKAAVIYGKNTLGINYPNPFSDGIDGKPIAGYVDMVGTVNNPDNEENPDHIFGFETAPARNSASEAVRRKDATDTDNNSIDFMRARYGYGASGATSGNLASMTAEEFEAYRPRNSSAGSWSAFATPVKFENLPGVDYSKLKLNEVNGVTNQKWFEIYNTGDAAINLAGVSAYYSNVQPADYRHTWTGTSLDVIPAKGYFATPVGDASNFGTGLSANNANVRLQLRKPDGAALDTYEKLPDTNTNGTYPALYNRAHARIPDGTGNWYYLVKDSTGTHGATNGTSTANCIRFGNEESAIPEPPEPTDNTLLIFQVAAPNNNTSNPINYCFVELYNNGDTKVNLTGYSLQYASGSNNVNTPDSGWTKIDLSGEIEPKHSFLIRGKLTSTNASPALNLANITPDLSVPGLELDNTAYKIALMRNTTLLTVNNPFDIDGNGTKASGYVDMLGAINTGNNNGVIRGYETEARTGLTRQMGIRRTSLIDRDNNGYDFIAISYGTASVETLEKIRPRTHSQGAWTPQF